MNLQKLCRRVLPVLSLATVLDFSLLLAQNEQIKFQRIGLEQGLSQSSILCMLQDRHGFMWFGTQDGLNRYDGYSFLVHRHEPRNANSLSNSTVISLIEDHDGALWIGTERGLNRFDPRTQHVTRFFHDPAEAQSLSDNWINAIWQDEDGVLWVGTSNGLNRFDQSTGECTRFFHAPQSAGGPGRNWIVALYEDHLQNLWVVTSGGLFELEANRKNHARDTADFKASNLGRISAMAQGHARLLWLGTTKGELLRFQPDNASLSHSAQNTAAEHIFQVEHFIHSILEDRNGGLWIGSERGLNVFEPTTRRFTRFFHDPQNPSSLSDNSISSLYQDRSGMLWVGTSAGLDKLTLPPIPFRHFLHTSSAPGNNFVLSLCEDHTGVLWVGTQEGLHRFDREAGRFTRVIHDPHNVQNAFKNNINVIFEDSARDLWVGTISGLYRRTPEGSFTAYAYDKESPRATRGNNIFFVKEDHSKTLWVGTNAGVDKFDATRSHVERYVPHPGDPYSLSNDFCLSILETRDGTIWIGTLGGLHRLNRNTSQFTRFVHDPNDPSSISSDQINAIHEDRHGGIWLATGSGLNKFERATERFTAYTTEDGLANNIVVGILEDDHENLWLSTARGLSRFNYRTRVFRNYDSGDGLQSNEFNPAYFKNAKGEMFFGGINGFNVFHPDSIRDNPYVPPVVITKFTRFNADEAQGSAAMDETISAKEHIELSYKDNILTFEFAALSYLNNAKNQYAYKLEGFNDNWIHLGTKREVTFTNLDAGDYTLRVKGSNNDGIWNEEGTALKITITPPWWKTTWAYALYFLLLAGIIYSLRRYELNRLHLKNQLQIEHVNAEKMKELDQLKSRFFANISHEFRTPLTLILGPVEQMRAGAFKGNVHEAYDMILRNGKRLLRLINQLLDLARLEAGSMALQTRSENVVIFLKGLVFSFASAAERKRIDLRVSCPEESLIVYFDRDKLEKIVSNLLSNALKFTPEGGSVSVQLSVTGDQLSVTSDQLSVVSHQLRRKPLNTDHWPLNTGNWLLLTVKDTGSGIPAELREKIFDRFYQVDASHTREHEGTGIGLALTKELVELHDGEIFVESEVGIGSTFFVRLPLRLASSEQLAATGDQFDEARGMEQSARLQAGALPASQDPNKPSIQHSTTPSPQESTPLLLLIEDHPDVRAYMRHYLEPGFRIIEAADGEVGVALALETIPDLIICDVMMPKRDGHEVCRILKTEEKTSHVPIIMLTAKADRDSKVHGLETGADDYLIKPFDAAELLARVHNLIKLRQQLRERFGREITLQPKDIAVTSMDEQFLTRAMQIVEEHMSDSQLGVEFLAHKIGMSRVHLNRKLRALTDQTANEFIRTLRLQRAAQLLQRKSATVLEIAYAVGFNNPSHFAECFAKQFGVLPSKFVE